MTKAGKTQVWVRPSADLRDAGLEMVQRLNEIIPRTNETVEREVWNDVDFKLKMEAAWDLRF